MDKVIPFYSKVTLKFARKTVEFRRDSEFLVHGSLHKNIEKQVTIKHISKKSEGNLTNNRFAAEAAIIIIVIIT